MAVKSVIRLHRSICFLATACLLIPEPYTYNFRAFAQEQAATDPAAGQQADADRPEPLSEDELEVLVARIALYPDELVALIASASLFPLQIVEAERYLDNLKKNKDLKPKDSWDGSVISLLNYPDIVTMMSEDIDWTQSLSDAMAYQQKDVLIAIQQLRDKAVASGVLKTDDKMTIVQENDNVIIQAANPEKIYIPQYEPEMLYAPNYAPEPLSYYPEPYPNYYYPAATFFAGAVTGAVFGAMVDWDDWGVWGGRYDGDIDVDCNNCFNNINGKVKFNDIDWKNVDRSKINIDKNQLAKFDRSNMKNRIEANGNNNIRDKAKITRSDASANLRQKVDTGSFKDLKDVRSNKLDGAKNRAGNARPNAGAGNRQAGAAGAAQRPGNISKPGGGSGGKVNRPASKPRPAGKADNRPRKPSGLGEVRSGKATQVQSRRGGQAMGGGARSGSRPHRSVGQGGGGGGRSVARHGGGGGARHGGGGGRGGGGRR
ncbi:hypothetical protein BLJAPNOD_01580 [Ensifer sp. M14]|uniref:DUF3300 domain-containing protein n=1 Tax=Ensifer sp. M14 TaxID=2203782 RepID=UPI000E1D46E6|nr:DUF3300 domain-containing protein [Ensifer sp. M14]RDL50459.1 hypothetical protein BLJAPNOD_01580 [Ensifer sp. M14]